LSEKKKNKDIFKIRNLLCDGKEIKAKTPVQIRALERYNAVMICKEF
jgi:hypothetical protein